MAACTHSFGLWLAALARLLGLTPAKTPHPDYSRVSMPDLDMSIAQLDAVRVVYLDYAEDLQIRIEALLEEKACRIHAAENGMTYERKRHAVPAYA